MPLDWLSIIYQTDEENIVHEGEVIHELIDCSNGLTITPERNPELYDAMKGDYVIGVMGGTPPYKIISDIAIIPTVLYTYSYFDLTYGDYGDASAPQVSSTNYENDTTSFSSSVSGSIFVVDVTEFDSTRYEFEFVGDSEIIGLKFGVTDDNIHNLHYNGGGWRSGESDNIFDGAYGNGKWLIADANGDNISPDDGITNVRIYGGDTMTVIADRVNQIFTYMINGELVGTIVPASPIEGYINVGFNGESPVDFDIIVNSYDNS